MASKNYYLNLVFGIIILAVTAFVAGYIVAHRYSSFIMILFLVIIFAEAMLFAHIMNSTNRKIATFFQSVQNDDTSIVLPKTNSNRSIKEIYSAMNNVVELFRIMKMDSEFQRQLFMAMIEHSSTGFISIDKYGDFEIMNETARKLLGVEFTSNLERLSNEFPQLYNLLVNLKPGMYKSCQLDVKGIQTIIQVSSSVIKFKDKDLTLVSLLDIKKEIESRELESWQKLIRILNHEIMNSIAPIISVSKSLSKIFIKNNNPVQSNDLNEKLICDTINGLEVIESMSTGLSSFVHHYRELSKVPEPIIVEIDVAKWKETILTVCKELISKNDALLQINIDATIKKINGDEKLLNQVIVNLIKNAAEVPVNQGQKKIVVDFLPGENQNTLIKVRNNGELIPPEIIDQIFVPFFTTKESGAGIGLFLSRQIINLHQGSISVTSDKNEGTVFTIEL